MARPQAVIEQQVLQPLARRIIGQQARGPVRRPRPDDRRGRVGPALRPGVAESEVGQHVNHRRLGPAVADLDADADVLGIGFGRVPLCVKLYHTQKHRCIFPDCGYDLVAAGQTVMHEGERGDTAYVVDRGRLQVRTARPDGGDAVVAELGPGEWVGEMSLLLDKPRSATVVALTGAQLRPFTRESFGRILVEDPDRAQALMRQLAAGPRDANRRLAG